MSKKRRKIEKERKKSAEIRRDVLDRDIDLCIEQIDKEWECATGGVCVQITDNLGHAINRRIAFEDEQFRIDRYAEWNDGFNNGYKSACIGFGLGIIATAITFIFELRKKEK